MRKLGIMAGVAAMALPGMAQSAAVAPAVALLRTSTSFDLVVRAPYARTAPLFGPQGERGWAGKHWDPGFIYPQPARDEQGAVFIIKHGPLQAVWVNTLFDLEARYFQYVYFLPGLLVTTIDVHFAPGGAASTAVHVVYTRTAIAPEGNEHVTAMTEGDKRAGAEWQKAIDTYLAASGTAH